MSSPSLTCPVAMEAIKAGLEQYSVSEAVARRDRKREAAWRCSEGVSDLPFQVDQALKDAEAQLQAAARKEYMVDGDFLFALKLSEYENSTDQIFQTISRICEARMDKEICQVEKEIHAEVFQKELEQFDREEVWHSQHPVAAYCAWQSFVAEHMVDFTADQLDEATSAFAEEAVAWWKQKAELYPIYVVDAEDDEGNPSGLNVVQVEAGGGPQDDGNFVTTVLEGISAKSAQEGCSWFWEAEGDVWSPAPKEIQENADLCEMSEDMDLFDLECDIDHAIQHYGNVPADGPAEAMGVQVYRVGLVQGTDDLPFNENGGLDISPVDPRLSIWCSIKTEPVPFTVHHVGAAYHTATWKYGKAFIGKWDVGNGLAIGGDQFQVGATGIGEMKMAGGNLKWRVVNQYTPQKIKPDQIGRWLEKKKAQGLWR